jgi:hypothetical protein
MRIPTLALLLSITAVLVGCGTAPSLQEVPMPDLSVNLENPRMGRIYLFRNDQQFGTRHDLTIYRGDQRLGSIGPSDFFCWEQRPGRTNLHLVLVRSGLQMGTREGIALLDLEPGAIRYGRIEFPVSNRRPTVIWVTPADGRDAISRLRPAPTVR